MARLSPEGEIIRDASPVLDRAAESKRAATGALGPSPLGRPIVPTSFPQATSARIGLGGLGITLIVGGIALLVVVLLFSVSRTQPAPPAAQVVQVTVVVTAAARPQSPAGQSVAAVQQPAAPPRPNSTATPNAEQIRGEVTKWLDDRQRVKEQTTKPPYDVSTLSSLMSGEALSKEIDAVSWLRTNHAYYQFYRSDPPTIENLDIRDANNLVARVRKVESYDLIYQSPSRVVPTRDNVYIVNYTLQRTDRWRVVQQQLMDLKGNPLT